MNIGKHASASWSTVSRLSLAQTRSICCENPTGAKGGGARAVDGIDTPFAERAGLGVGWKANPRVIIPAGSTYTLAEIAGEGVIQQIWITPGGLMRHWILRMYWEEEEQPSVECPLGDFFCNGWDEVSYVNSLPVCVNPGSGYNCYWEMPFRRRAKITLTNLGAADNCVYYQINYALGDVPPDAGYFHAQFRRVNPLPYKTEYTILDGVRGIGHYVGTYLAWGVNHNGWWGEGEIKFYLDGDREFPTICGTGTEDYFCGSYNFEDHQTHQYREFCTPYAGMPQVIRPDGVYRSQQRFGLYRWHLTDPVRFARDLKVTIQALGWRTTEPRRYLPLQDDIASVAFWYQTLPASPFPPLPDRDQLEVI